MKNDKKEKQLLEIKELIEKVKEEYPESDNEKAQELIEQIEQLIAIQKEGKLKYLLRTLFQLIKGYIIYFFVVVMVMGFGFSFFDFNEPRRLFYIIPVLALIVLLLTECVDALIHLTFLNKKIILNGMLLYTIVIGGLCLIDYFFVHLYGGLWQSIISMVLIFILGEVAVAICKRAKIL